MGKLKTAMALSLVMALLAGGTAFALPPRNPENVDLEISGTNITFDPGHAGAPRLNDNLKISALVNNLGGQPAVNVNVSFYYNMTDMPLVLITFSPFGPGKAIEPGGNATVNVFWDTGGLGLEAGVEYMVWVRVQNDTQPANQSDSNPDNNQAFASITFQPDVIPFVQDFTTSADNALVGETIRLMASLNNSGIRPAASEPVSFFLDYLPAPFQVNNTDIPAGVTTYVAFQWNTTGVSDGQHTVTVKVRQSQMSALITLKYRTNPYLTAITASSYQAHIGDQLLLNVTLNNNGTETAQFVTVDFYLDAGGNPLGNLTASEVAVGTPTWLSFSWDTSTVPPGNHTVKARVADTKSEMRTANITLLPQLLPDLTVSNVTVSSASPLVGEVLNISVNVTNLGDRDSPVNATLQLLLDYLTPIAADVLLPSLAPGESLLHTLLWDTREVSPMKHTLLVQVIPSSELPEKSETNNDFRLDLFFQGSIDLAVESITFTQVFNQSNTTDEITVGDFPWVWVRVANYGSLSNAFNTSLALYLDDSALPFMTFSLPSIAGGRNISKYFNWNSSVLKDTVVTAHVVRAIADPARQNSDANWTNNELRVNLTVHPFVPPADLAVLALHPAKGEVENDEVLIVTSTITNSGGRPASNVTVRFTLQSGQYQQRMGDKVIAFIQPSETLNVTITWTVMAAPDNYTIMVNLDPTNFIEEISKANNLGYANLTVLPAEERAPLLQVNLVGLQPPRPKVGDNLNISLTVSNLGNAPAFDVVVTLLVNGMAQSDLNISELQPGQVKNVSFRWTLRSGDGNLTVLASAAGLGPRGTPVPLELQAEAEPAGSYLPMVVIIILLIAAVVAVLAFGGQKGRAGAPEEEARSDRTKVRKMEPDKTRIRRIDEEKEEE